MDRKSKGRKKIDMVKIEKESNLQVTFSKRRSGIFKKASELSTLCGVELAILVFSPGNKAYSFGNPSLESIFERFLSRHPPPTNNLVDQLVEAHRDANIRELNDQLTHLESIVEADRKRGETLNRMNKEAQDKFLFRTPIDHLNLEQLEQMKNAMVELRLNVTKKVDRLTAEAMNAQPVVVVPPSSNGGGDVAIDPNASGSSTGGALVPHGFDYRYGPGF